MVKIYVSPSIFLSSSNYPEMRSSVASRRKYLIKGRKIHSFSLILCLLPLSNGSFVAVKRLKEKQKTVQEFLFDPKNVFLAFVALNN